MIKILLVAALLGSTYFVSGIESDAECPYLPPTILVNRKVESPCTMLGDAKEDLIRSLKAGVQALRTDLPLNFGRLVTNLETNHRFDIRETDTNGVEGVLKEWQLPQEVHNFLFNI